MHLKQGKYERAKDYLNQGLEIAKKENNMIKYLKNKLGIGKALLKTGDPESAVIHLSEAMELGENSPYFVKMLSRDRRSNKLSPCFFNVFTDNR